MNHLLLLLVLFAVLTGICTYAAYLDQHPKPPEPVTSPEPLVEKETPTPAPTPISYMGRRIDQDPIAVASSGSSSSSSSVISVNGVQIAVTEEGGDVKITRTDAKNGTVVINPKQEPIDNSAGEVSVPIVAKDPKDTGKLERLVSRLWVTQSWNRNLTEAETLEVRTLRRELVSLLSPEDFAKVKELRLRCDNWSIELGLADPLFVFTECGTKK